MAPMEATVLSWTRVERPPAGFAPGQVVVLVQAPAGGRCARWAGPGDPRIGAVVVLRETPGGWVAERAAE